MPAMSESVQKLTRRIDEFQGAARKARLEARLLTASNAEIADKAQAQTDRPRAEEHERKYYR
jgi:hypothetical protein